MMIIETCPTCGHDLVHLVIATYPPIPKKKCFNCGWEWTGERDGVVRVPFDLDKHATITYNRINNISPCEYCSNNPKNGGSGICNCIMGSLGQFTC